jgi:glycosyltransferase involved in cell wall biosynthesis
MENCTSILIDSALRNSKGHYDQFSYDFRQALIRSGKKVVYISPSADLAKESDGAVSPLISYQFIDVISKPSFFHQSLEVVKKVTESSSEPFHLIFLRANDLAAGNLIDWSKFIEEHQQIDLKVLINVSGVISNSSHSKSEREVLNKLGIFKDKIHFMAWDFRVTKSKEFSNFEYLPLYKNSVKKSNIKSQLQIGFFGKLTSDRGLTDLLFSAILNPQLKFVIKGYGLSFKYLYRRPGFLSVKKTPIKAITSFFLTLYIFLLTKLPNVSISEVYFDTEAKMTAEIQNCSAIFWSCRRSPYESGIVIQALAAGVPVVWLNGQSAMAQILSAHYPSGEIPIKKLYQFRGLQNFVLSVKDLEPSAPYTFEEFQSVASNCSCP